MSEHDSSSQPQDINKNKGRSNIISDIFFRVLNIHKFPDPYIRFYDTTKTPDIYDYINNRLEPQVNWYHTRAVENMYRFHASQMAIIAISALIPIINVVGFSNDFWVRILSSIFGGLIAGITGFLQLTKANENWVLFRSSAEALKREYHLFMLKSGDYSDANLKKNAMDQLFIERIESIIASETSKYFSSQQRIPTNLEKELNSNTQKT